MSDDCSHPYCGLCADALPSIRKLEAQLAALTAERDALKAGKWAGRWTRRAPPPGYPEGWHSWRRGSDVATWTCFANVHPNADVTHWYWDAGRYTGTAPTADEAKAAADAALLAAGWWMEDA